MLFPGTMAGKCVCVLARAREVNELSRTYEEEILF